MSGGKHTCEGVVQLVVGSHDKQTSILTACSREFGDEEARVLCSQLGCRPGERVHKSRSAKSHNSYNNIIIDRYSVTGVPIT